MYRLLFCCLVSVGFLLACGSGETPATDTPPEPPLPAAAPPAPVTGTTPYEPLPVERLEYLFFNCDYVDYIFYATNFSMSQSEQAAIQSTLAAVGADAPTIYDSCQPIGRVFFQVDGQNTEEADIYLSEQCLYYLWLENGKPAYANLMTENAVKFYASIFQQVQQGAPQ